MIVSFLESRQVFVLNYKGARIESRNLPDLVDFGLKHYDINILTFLN